MVASKGKQGQARGRFLCLVITSKGTQARASKGKQGEGSFAWLLKQGTVPFLAINLKLC